MAITQEQFNQNMLEELLAIQAKAELKMLKKVANRVAKGAKTEGWNENKLNDMQLMRKEIEAILADKDKLSKVWTSKNLMKSYDNAGKQVSVKLHQPHSAMKGVVPYRLQRLILETQNAISGTSFQILRDTMDVYREVISESTSGVLIGSDTRLQASQQMLNDFAAKGVTGFVDKIGRKWELASYVEMATRTANSRAALQGHVDRSLELNQDLMMVSGHAATCPICAPWGNRVISISGNTPDYPSLASAQAAGLFHPNCKHTLTVWFPDLEGNVEHAEANTQQPDIEKYNAIQKQRYNERKIREAKRLEAVAITPLAKVKAHNQLLKWQDIQRQHVKEYNLKRKYVREGIKNRTGDPTKATVPSNIPKPIVTIPNNVSVPEMIVEPSIKSLYSHENDGTLKDYNYNDVVKMSKASKRMLLHNNSNMKLIDLVNMSAEEIDNEIDKMFKPKTKPTNIIQVPLTFEDLADKIEDLEIKIKTSTSYKDLIALDKELVNAKAELAKLMPPMPKKDISFGDWAAKKKDEDIKANAAVKPKVNSVPEVKVESPKYKVMVQHKLLELDSSGIDKLSSFDKYELLVNHSKVDKNELAKFATPDWMNNKIKELYIMKPKVTSVPPVKSNIPSPILPIPKKVPTSKVIVEPQIDTPIKSSINKTDGQTSNQIDDLLSKQTSDWRTYRDKYNNIHDKWDTQVTTLERSAVKKYTGSSYHDMNGVLRGTQESDTATDNLIKRCAKALEKTSLEEDTVVRRGVSISGFAGMFDERDLVKQIGRSEWLKGLDSLVGRVAHDKGFLSTSPNDDGGFNRQVEIKILLPKGTQALYVEKVSKYANEKEILVQKGYSYEVVSTSIGTKHDDRMPVIYLKAIPFP